MEAVVAIYCATDTPQGWSTGRPFSDANEERKVKQSQTVILPYMCADIKRVRAFQAGDTGISVK